MRFASFADILESIESSKDVPQETLRAFGLKHPTLCENPAAMLQAWHSKVRLQTPGRWKEALQQFSVRLSFIFYVSAFFLGLLAAGGLLRYNGTEPVNIFYFLLVGVGLPAVTLLVALAALLKAKDVHNVWLHSTVGYWIERWVLRRASREIRELVSCEPRIAEWMLLQKGHAAALWFAFGMLVGLIVTVATQDIAFVWSTTLDVSSERMAQLLEAFAAPWHHLWPSAVPDATLVEQSRYFRLGGHISSELVLHADRLGTWWKFLAASVLFYTVFPRLLSYVTARYYLGRIVRQTLTAHAEALLEAMCTSTVKQQADEVQRVRRPKHDAKATTCTMLSRYDVLAGIGFDEDMLRVAAEREGVVALRMLPLGGARSLEEDETAVATLQGDVAVLVKSWEPPTFETLDLLRLMTRYAKKVHILPVGLEGESVEPRHRRNWEIKLAETGSETLCLIS